MNIDPMWHKNVVADYSQNEFSHYETYVDTLSRILSKACKAYAPLAIVQARPKGVSSFAEKAARKAFKYSDPVRQLTDLCGARVITHSQDQVNQICEFIRSHFIVDEANSLDVRTRLQQSEFGYLSVHYIVQLAGEPVLGIPIPEEIGDRKAEIQVRTLLQHAWADITHDRLYKSGFDVPKQFTRSAAMLAATMEDADGSYARFAEGIDAYAGNYAACMSGEEMAKEIAILQLVLHNEPKPDNKPGIALRIAQIAKAAGDCQTAIEALAPFAKVEHELQDTILMELGGALIGKDKDNPESAGFSQGQQLLRRAGRPEEPVPPLTSSLGRQARIVRASALSMLARSCGDLPGKECRARDYSRQALALDPDNPYHLVSLLENEIFCTRSQDFAAAMCPVLLNAVKTCREHAEVGIELPQAYFAIGKLNLVMDRPSEALAGYAKAVSFCNSRGDSVPHDVYDTQLEFLRRINTGRELPNEHRWARQLLLLGSAVKGDQPALDKISSLAVRKTPFQGPVLIVAGGTQHEVQAKVNDYGGCLGRALQEFHGTVVSGGTRTGIPGLVGEIASELSEKDARQFALVGYLSQYLPADAPEDSRYDELIQTAGQTLSLQEPLQAWIDLLAGSVNPSEVRLLGINGGEISAFEYRLALALGAKVGVIESSGGAADALRDDPDWADSPNLLLLPPDETTILSFVDTPKSLLKPDQLEETARAAHARYVEDNKHTMTDPSMRPWEELSDDLKESNRQQVACAERTLRAARYGLREIEGEAVLAELCPEEVEAMSEMEHGRWNAERLAAGWKFGPKRDPENKISPYVVPWQDLAETIKDYDRQAVRDLPRIFAEVGLEVYRL